MFRENVDHFQPSLLDADNLMTRRSRMRLEKSWAVPFYRDVFCNIDESKFKPLFSNTGAPNTPVNILVSLELFKYMFRWSDDQLMDEYDFNYLVNYAVGQWGIVKSDNGQLRKRRFTTTEPVYFSTSPSIRMKKDPFLISF